LKCSINSTYTLE